MKRPSTSFTNLQPGPLLCAFALVGLGGCQSLVINNADKQVYRAIEERQRDALGATSDVNIGPETGRIGHNDDMYSFVPRRTTLEVPAEFETPRNERQQGNEATEERQQGNEAARQRGVEATKPRSHEATEETPKRQNAETPKEDEGQPSPRPSPEGRGGTAKGTEGPPVARHGGSETRDPGSDSPSPRPSPEGRGGTAQIDNRKSQIDNQAAEAAEPEMMSPDIFAEQQRADVQTFGLVDALAYAQRHGRDMQDAKETLYLAALDLTLERHLWTPQFSAGIQAEYLDQWQDIDLDRAMTAVADAAVTQRLPLGGTVTARMVSSLVRDLRNHATTGESGNLILEADIPLFRGAGRVAYESRYQSERDLIYAVRNYERFRRQYLVQVASNYFDLQLLRSAIANTYTSYKNRRLDWEKAEFTNRVGQSKNIFEAPRALSSFRQAEAALVRAKESYEAGLDRFKIFIGMPVPELLDVLEQNADADAAALDDLLPEVEVATAVEVALKLRLDLLNQGDRIDDAKRGVVVAKNQILPDVNATGGVTLDSNPEHFNSTNFSEDRDTWRAGISARMDDRKRERNAYRASLIAMRKAERDYEVGADTVRADVRRAARRVLQQAKLRDIQSANVAENELRREAASAQFDLGLITNRDVVDAETDLLSARNELAAAISAYREAILEFRRDTETLRVTDEGQWVRP